MSTILLLLLVIIILAIFSGKSEVSGNWSHLFAGMQHDPEKFYDLVEETLKERQVPDFKTARKVFSEGTYGLLSHNRCLLYTSDAADERSSVDLGGSGKITKKIK